MDEDEQIARAKQGDPDAFGMLYTKYYPRVVLQCRKIVGQDAEDVAQKTFAKLWEKIPQFQNKSAFATWLFKAAHNHCLMHLRSIKKHKDDVPESLLYNMPAKHVPIERVIDSKNLWDRVCAEAKKLSPAKQEVFEMHNIREMTHREIGAVRSKTKAGTKTVHHRMLKDIREALQQEAAA